ncbi:MAG: peptidylprolyl isomerase [Robiginitomaculum sp.]|nr:MAG: peptidylprolyl isomerase [Robiginitomaculum sp.]
MRKFLTLAVLLPALALSACSDTPEEKAAKEADALVAQTAADAALRVCAPQKVLTDISSYSNDVADTSLNQTEWFEANGKREGVVTTASGLQYSVNKSGNAEGPTPVPTQTVRVHYHGQFLGGEKFDSSYDRGEDIDFPLNGVIKGWTEGVGLMRPCDAWTFYIPSDLAYGPSGRGSIPPATPLMFHVQLIEITD